MMKWLFFDVGSTIVDERNAYQKRLQDIADAAGVTYEAVLETAMDFYRANRKGDKEAAKCYGVSLTPWHVEEERLYPDAAQSLEMLHKQYKIGIIANQDYGTRERLERYGVLSYIDLIIASAEEGVSKPDRRIFEIALKRSGCNPEDAMMIGDRIDNDIVPAKALGMRTAWIKQGFGAFWNITMECEKADLAVDNLSELCEKLR